MSPSFNIAEQTALAQSARTLLDAGVAQDLVLGLLRKGGLGMLNSIKVISELTGTPMVEAQRAVQKSRAWQHGFEKDAALQAQIAEAFAALKEEQ